MFHELSESFWKKNNGLEMSFFYISSRLGMKSNKKYNIKSNWIVRLVKEIVDFKSYLKNLRL